MSRGVASGDCLWTSHSFYCFRLISPTNRTDRNSHSQTVKAAIGGHLKDLNKGDVLFMSFTLEIGLCPVFTMHLVQKVLQTDSLPKVVCRALVGNLHGMA